MMAAQLVLMLAVGLMDSGADARADVGRGQLDFSVPSRWILVKGWKGSATIVRASVSFERSDLVEIEWTATTEEDGRRFSSTQRYRLDPHSGPRVLSESVAPHLAGRPVPTFRMVGNRLELKIPDHPLDGLNLVGVPPGAVRLLLKPAP
jgi:hypothetical protein